MTLIEARDLAGGPERQSALALRAEALDGVRLAARLRIVTVPVVMVLLLVVMRDDRSMLFVQACLVVFALAGLGQIAIVRSDRYRAWHGYLVVALDMALIGFAIFGTQLLFEQPWPEQTLLHSRPIVFYFFVMATVALSLPPLLMLWAGVMAALSWSAGGAVAGEPARHDHRPAHGPGHEGAAGHCAPADLHQPVDLGDRWNAKRGAWGATPIRLAIGLHMGEVVLGDVGSERRLEYAVIGDTVNVAARIEQLVRELDARIVASDETVAAARDQGADLTGFKPAGEHALRGREAPVALWRLPL